MISLMHIEKGRIRGGAVYTVIRKSGQRGTVYSDPCLAAQAFMQAPEHDRPFVLRHLGDASIVIASSKTGGKQIVGSCSDDDQFRSAYESLLQRDRPHLT